MNKIATLLRLILCQIVLVFILPELCDKKVKLDPLLANLRNYLWTHCTYPLSYRSNTTTLTETLYIIYQLNNWCLLFTIILCNFKIKCNGQLYFNSRNLIFLNQVFIQFWQLSHLKSLLPEIFLIYALLSCFYRARSVQSPRFLSWSTPMGHTGPVSSSWIRFYTSS